jgi:hypothetical protein
VKNLCLKSVSITVPIAVKKYKNLLIKRLIFVVIVDENLKRRRLIYIIRYNAQYVTNLSGLDEVERFNVLSAVANTTILA